LRTGTPKKFANLRKRNELKKLRICDLRTLKKSLLVHVCGNTAVSQAEIVPPSKKRRFFWSSFAKRSDVSLMRIICWGEGEGEGESGGRHLPDRQHLFYVLPAAKNDSYATEMPVCIALCQYCTVYIFQKLFLFCHTSDLTQANSNALLYKGTVTWDKLNFTEWINLGLNKSFALLKKN
jgi:hypothetical protein